LCSIVLLCVAACATPAARIDALAKRHGAVRETISGSGFEHAVYTRGIAATADSLRIYFEGDGLPWVRRDLVSDDPTPRRPLALELMLADPGAAAYVARPCYQSMGPRAQCVPALWTSARYSEAVVATMRVTVQRLLERTPHATATLVGYSGGGVLALLVAEREARIATVATIAANLDVAGWTRLHGYSPLADSLDPMTTAHWRAGLKQIHFVGSKDENVPAALIRAFGARVPNAELRVVDGFDHRCCWVKEWPELVRGLSIAPTDDPTTSRGQ
jgi:dienelactone hydrolase